MPATRRSAAASGPSLLNHFQATKPRAQAINRSSSVDKGKAKAQHVEIDHCTPPASSSNPSSQAPAQARISGEALQRFETPEPLGAPGRMCLYSSSSSLSSSSPTRQSPETLELLQPEHKSSVSVRQDPDRKKLFLIISPNARNLADSKSGDVDAAIASLSSASSQTAQLNAFQRAGSPATDRTPVRETPATLREPPQAPRKRRLSHFSYQALRSGFEHSPVPVDKKRPSFKTFEGSQESGLSLAEAGHTLERPYGKKLRLDGNDSVEHTCTSSRTIQGDCPTWSRRSEIGDDEDGDTDLLITPRKVRQCPVGHPLTSFATPKQAATFVDPFKRPRPKPTLSAGIFSFVSSSKEKPAKQHPRHPKVTLGSEEDNPFLDGELAQASDLERQEAAKKARSSVKSIIAPIYTLSTKLPLPNHYQSLLMLHTAIEHALVVQLATTGIGSSSTTFIDTASVSGASSSLVRLPNLITFGALRPLVERTAGRRLGSIELARLMYVWSNGSAISTGLPTASNPPLLPPKRPGNRSDPEYLSGLGFLLGRQRILDGSGRRKWDWSLGIELTLYRARREATPPLQVSYGPSEADSTSGTPRTPDTRPHLDGVLGAQTPPSTPPSSKRRRNNSGDVASPCSPLVRRDAVGRQGMSFVALWNNGVEERKAEVARRLRALCAAEMEVWLQSQDTSRHLVVSKTRDERLKTPEPDRSGVEVGAGGLITPSSTRATRRQAQARFVHHDEAFLAGRDTETSSPVCKEDWQRPAGGEELTRWHPRWALKDCTPVPCALLPNLNDLVDVANRVEGSTKRRSLPPTSTPTPASNNAEAAFVKSASASSSLSLVERIREKEAQQKAVMSMHDSLLNGVSNREDAMSNFKRRSTLSRLNDVASNLYLLFTSSPALLTEARRGNRLPVLPLADVLTSMAKSAKVVLSAAEARGALELLKEICPDFVDVQNMGGKEWVRLCAGEVGLSDVRQRVKEELQKTM